MASELVFVLLFVLATFAAARDHSDSRAHHDRSDSRNHDRSDSRNHDRSGSHGHDRSGSRSRETTEKPNEIVSCAAMQCPVGYRCEEGRVICPFAPPCFTRPTQCVPNEPSPDSSEESSGSGDGAPCNCGMNMHTDTCGPVCPQDCSNEATCLAISCTDQERCFCNAGYVLLNKEDPSLGCVLPEDCPCAH
ncbi:hypothetical protein Y032_0060g3078 [Ancylostoma ceylanicum]|nr:hypothetical protein Y032_0060g3078 [Ancylostoma ceylanicum]